MLSRFIIGLSLLIISACSPGTPTTANDFQTVTTAQDNVTNFSAIKTYAMPDNVQAIQDPNSPNANSQVRSDVDAQIISKIQQNLNALGWTRLTDTAGPKPDVILTVSSMATTNTDVYYSTWYPYYGAYYGSWYGPTYSAAYVPATPVVVNTNVGSLIISMTNPNAPNVAEKKIPSVWVALLNNLLPPDLPQADVQAAAIAGIDQAFEQSPYLKGAQ